MKDNMIFELVDLPADEAGSVYHAGDMAVKFAEVSSDVQATLAEELDRWEIHRTTTWKDHDWVHNAEDSGEHTSIIPITSLVSIKASVVGSYDTLGGYLLRDGELIGVVLFLENITSYGMAWSKKQECCILFTDGTSCGKTTRHYSHCSTEKDETLNSVYTLCKK